MARIAGLCCGIFRPICVRLEASAGISQSWDSMFPLAGRPLRLFIDLLIRVTGWW